MNRVILLQPLINEKSMNLTTTGFYTFLVDKDATKEQIAKAIVSKFKVTPLSVSVINQKGKNKMQRAKRAYYKTKGVRKAIIKLKDGQKIALFETVPAEEESKEVEIRTAEGEVVGKTKEKKSLLKGTKVKIETVGEDKGQIVKEEETRTRSGKLGKSKGEK